MSLHRINPMNQNSAMEVCKTEIPSMPPRYNRDEKEDMKEAIELLYAFKKKLDVLHPVCIELIQNMLTPGARY